MTVDTRSEEYLRGVSDGRRQAMASVGILVASMLEAIRRNPDNGLPVEAHTKTCWTRHAKCALTSVNNRIEKERGNVPSPEDRVPDPVQ